MVNKVRVRGGAPQYTAGLGDGHVELQLDNKKKTPDDETEASQQKAGRVRARNRNKHGEKWLERYQIVNEKVPAQQEHHGVAAGEPDPRFGLSYAKSDAKETTSSRGGGLQQQHAHHRFHPHRRYFVISGVWETPPAVVFGAAVFVVFISAVFIHLISVGANVDNRKRLHHGRVLKKKHSRVEKKKTDEWNEDAEEEGLLSDSVRGTGGSEDDSQPLYYPYQPRLQQHRHRKNSSSGVVVVSHTNPQTTTVQHRSYYLNQSGSAVIAGNTVQKSPGGPQKPIKSSSNRGLGSTLSPHSSPTPSIPAQPAQQQLIFQSPNINARVLSTSASSFESLTGNSGEGTKPKLENLLGEFNTPQRQSPHASSGQQQNFTVLGSPKPSGSIDQDEDLTPRIRQGRSRIEVFDQTPRVANGRQTMQPSVPEHSPLQVGNLQQRSTENDDVDLKFASPPNLRHRNQQPEPIEEDPTIPFVPFLDVHVAHTRPPRSIKVDDLHLCQLMESGNVSHWEERVAEESRQLEKKLFPEEESNDDIKTVIMASATESSDATSTDNSIPDDDPRKGIQHKRKDLTFSTDASSSLQGTIDFDELQLIDVIGGGGFGQVYKAMWRGTPVAVKVLTGSAQSQSVPRAVLEEFAAEINLLKGMRHPNICLYMGACLEPPNRAIITELAANGSLWDALRLPLAPPYVPCDGLTREGWPMSLYQPDSKHGVPPTASAKPGSLSAVPPKGTWHWILVKRVACGAARGMAYLHSGKPPILHRDLKSANILLDDSYTAKVCDFGLSRLRAQERSMTGNVGTVQWMPPEVLANQSYNEKADVYSYGIICWELLTRQCPYDKMTPIQCALAVLNRNQRPEIPKWCPPSLQALIRSCIKRDPDERPSFSEILDKLDKMP